MAAERRDRVLAIDAGNTRIKWGLHDGLAWVASGALATSEAAAIGEAWAALPALDHAIACNVAGAEVEHRLADACAAHGAQLRIVAARAEQLGVVNGYRDPAQLGADRWAALVAAHTVGSGPKLVVNVGTALTIDALAADGRFLGGLIVPGPDLMRSALAAGTARLPLAAGAFREFPDTTDDAIASGALQACVGAILRMRHAMTGHGMAPDHVIVSGGAARIVAPLLPMPFSIHENLVLDGLARIARLS
ncbi:MAG TPA: type III pantothenate kinase [Usitatibacter sp.]|nr:type III pantothenate kinase [Usitatibacter sp.]